MDACPALCAQEVVLISPGQVQAVRQPVIQPPPSPMMRRECRDALQNSLATRLAALRLVVDVLR